MIKGENKEYDKIKRQLVDLRLQMKLIKDRELKLNIEKQIEDVRSQLTSIIVENANEEHKRRK